MGIIDESNNSDCFSSPLFSLVKNNWSFNIVADERYSSMLNDWFKFDKIALFVMFINNCLVLEISIIRGNSYGQRSCAVYV